MKIIKTLTIFSSILLLCSVPSFGEELLSPYDIALKYIITKDKKPAKAKVLLEQWLERNRDSDEHGLSHSQYSSWAIMIIRMVDIAN